MVLLCPSVAGQGLGGCLSLTGYVKPQIRYETSAQKYALKRQVLIFNQHICVPGILTTSELKLGDVERYAWFYNPRSCH